MEITNSKGSVWRKWDLHLHSTASDGKCSPEELIDESITKGIKVIALTDHHTVNNINEIKRLGKEKGISVISGIEFRTEYGQKSVHMIGLFPDKFEEMALDDYQELKLFVLLVQQGKHIVMIIMHIKTGYFKYRLILRKLQI